MICTFKYIFKEYFNIIIPMAPEVCLCKPGWVQQLLSYCKVVEGCFSEIRQSCNIKCRWVWLTDFTKGVCALSVFLGGSAPPSAVFCVFLIHEKHQDKCKMCVSLKLVLKYTSHIGTNSHF